MTKEITINQCFANLQYMSDVVINFQIYTNFSLFLIIDKWLQIIVMNMKYYYMVV